MIKQGIIQFVGLCFSVVVFSFASSGNLLAETSAPARVILNQPGWPTIFELNIGDSYTLRRNIDGKTIERVIKLISVTEYWEPDYWIKNNPQRRTLRKAEVVVEISGAKVTLLARPYQMPTVANGLRLYVEATRRWATETQLGKIRGMNSDIRLSAVVQGEGWGPSDMLFPIKDYRWRSSSYFNTWSSLVPYNLLYYHRGEDFGAIPDRLPVVAILPGKIISTPLPGGNRRSNGVIVETASGFRFRCSHMNIETFNQTLTVGTQVRAGQMIAKTGMTWDGRKSQSHDPHLHIGFHFGRTTISTYPFLIEAYLRMYDDEVMAVAGAYHFAVPGEPVELDASRSVSRPGRKITGYEWRLHNRKTIRGPQVRLTYDKPGLYCEELIVRADNGSEDRDFAQVRVYDPERGRNIVSGWLHYTPVRCIRPGTDVLFWNRLSGTSGRVTIDFGDGVPAETIGKEIRHAYSQPGIYTVTLLATGPKKEPATLKIRVVVEKMK